MGWYHLLKVLFLHKYPPMLDLLLVAVKPEYQNKGVNALLFSDLIPVYQQLGFKYAESNPELELNGKVQAQWEYFKTEQHKRRRAYKKEYSVTTIYKNVISQYGRKQRTDKQSRRRIYRR